MAFCSGCGAAVTENAKFCSACGAGASPSAPTSRLKPFGIIMLMIGGLFLLMAIMRYNSAASEGLRAFGGDVSGTDPQVVMQTIWGFADSVVGLLLFASEPGIFLKLTRAGLVVFVILMALLPIFAWIPWLIPGLKENRV